MAANPYEVVLKILKDNWNSSNTDGLTPEFSKIIDRKTISFGHNRDWVLLHRSIPKREPAGIGAGLKHKHERMKLDVRTMSTESHFLNLVTEVERILDSKINVFLVDNDYTILDSDGDWEDKSDKTQNIWRMMMTVKLSAYAQAR